MLTRLGIAIGCNLSKNILKFTRNENNRSINEHESTFIWNSGRYQILRKRAVIAFLCLIVIFLRSLKDLNHVCLFDFLSFILSKLK
jgi:hypothetical protein